MLRATRRFQANVDSLEGKTLLSSLPVLSSATFNQAMHQIDRAAGTFAKTHNANRFDAVPAQISVKIPYGHSQLLPTWQSDEGIYDPSVRGSGLSMVKQIKSDLVSYVQTSVAAASIAVSGHWPKGMLARTVADPVTPVLSNSTYQKALNATDRAAGTFAKTHNENAFLASLSQISTTIPYGHSQLFPIWQTDVGIYDPSVAGSGNQMVHQLKVDLTNYVQTGVSGGSFRAR